MRLECLESHVLQTQTANAERREEFLVEKGTEWEVEEMELQETRSKWEFKHILYIYTQITYIQIVMYIQMLKLLVIEGCDWIQKPLKDLSRVVGLTVMKRTNEPATSMLL